MITQHLIIGSFRFWLGATSRRLRSKELNLLTNNYNDNGGFFKRDAVSLPPYKSSQLVGRDEAFQVLNQDLEELWVSHEEATIVIIIV